MLSRHRQRRSFYVAGLMNAGWALYEIADHNSWTAREAWAIALVGCGLAGLAGGFALDALRRRTHEAAKPEGRRPAPDTGERGV